MNETTHLIARADLANRRRDRLACRERPRGLDEASHYADDVTCEDCQASAAYRWVARRNDQGRPA